MAEDLFALASSWALFPAENDVGGMMSARVGFVVGKVVLCGICCPCQEVTG
jgi:hypothetical protein